MVCVVGVKVFVYMHNVAEYVLSWYGYLIERSYRICQCIPGGIADVIQTPIIAKPFLPIIKPLPKPYVEGNGHKNELTRLHFDFGSNFTVGET